MRNLIPCITLFCLLTGANNHFIDIELDELDTNIIKCNFLNEISALAKSCKIEYGLKRSSQCHDDLPLNSEGNSTSFNIVHVHLQSSNYYQVEYCYRATASDGVKTIQIIGTFSGIL